MIKKYGSAKDIPTVEWVKGCTVELKCIYCGEYFCYTLGKRVHNYRRFCSDLCRQRASIKKLHPDKLILRNKICEWCGESFQTYRSYQRNCSKKCRTRDGWSRWHKRNKDTQKYKDSLRNAKLKKTFGIDLVTYNKMLRKQRGKCKICKRRRAAAHKAFAVDHCHKTGKVRGLLCFTCNGRLGWFEKFRDSVLEYLDVSRS